MSHSTEPNTTSRVSRRDFLRIAAVFTGGAILAACAPPAPAPATSPTQAPAAAKETVAPAPKPAEQITIRYRFFHPETNMLSSAQKRHLEKYNYMVPDTNIKVDLELGIDNDRTTADL